MYNVFVPFASYPVELYYLRADADEAAPKSFDDDEWEHVDKKKSKWVRMNGFQKKKNGRFYRLHNSLSPSHCSFVILFFCFGTVAWLCYKNFFYLFCVITFSKRAFVR